MDEVPVRQIELSWTSEIDIDHVPQKRDDWGQADVYIVYNIELA